MAKMNRHIDAELPPISDNPSSPDEVIPEAILAVPVAPKRLNMRTAIEEAFARTGGVDGLVTWINQSTANKRIFYKDIMTKVIPKEMTGELTGKNGENVKFKFCWDGGGEDEASPSSIAMQAIMGATQE